MPNSICTICGTQYVESASPPLGARSPSRSSKLAHALQFPWQLTDFLRARRLVEAGVSVVDLTVRCNDLPEAHRTGCRSDWDFHEDNFTGLQSMLPPFDQAVYALVTDLYERGLDLDVAVIIWGEMGRTPKINAKAGRDHWPQAGFTVVAGGGLKMGQVIGATDAQPTDLWLIVAWLTCLAT